MKRTTFLASLFAPLVACFAQDRGVTPQVVRKPAESAEPPTGGTLKALETYGIIFDHPDGKRYQINAMYYADSIG